MALIIYDSTVLIKSVKEILYSFNLERINLLNLINYVLLNLELFSLHNITQKYKNSIIVIIKIN